MPRQFSLVMQQLMYVLLPESASLKSVWLIGKPPRCCGDVCSAEALWLPTLCFIHGISTTCTAVKLVESIHSYAVVIN